MLQPDGDAGGPRAKKWPFSEEFTACRRSWGKRRFPKQLLGVIGSSKAWRWTSVSSEWSEWAYTAVTLLAEKGKGYSPLVFSPQTRFLLLEVAKGKGHIASEMPLAATKRQDPATSLAPAQNVGWQREGKIHLFSRRALIVCQSVRLPPLPRKASAVKRSPTVFSEVAARSILLQPLWSQAGKLLGVWKRAIL